jgi:hypothetical protein
MFEDFAKICPESLMFYRALLDVVEMTKQYVLIVPILYSIYWLLHVSAVACYDQGAS